MDEIDCSYFFEEMESVIDFAEENLRSVSCKEISSRWHSASGDLSVFDPILSGKDANAIDGSDRSSQLFVPYEEIVQLEWLSNFGEDSFSGGGMTLHKENAGVNKSEPPDSRFRTMSPVSVLDSSSTSSCTGEKNATVLSPTQRARTKRTRPPAFSPRPKTQLISPASSSVTANTQSSSESGTLIESQPRKKMMPKLVSGEQSSKKRKKARTMTPEMDQSQNQDQDQDPPSQGVRKCLHCEITKTPQWRLGPMGPKTLCNACGVRYKSGRLFPEYRPAASPTFSPYLHSNSHKKVLEMRTKTEDAASTKVAESDTMSDLIPNRNPSLDYACGD